MINSIKMALVEVSLAEVSIICNIVEFELIRGEAKR